MWSTGALRVQVKLPLAVAHGFLDRMDGLQGIWVQAAGRMTNVRYSLEGAV